MSESRSSSAVRLGAIGLAALLAAGGWVWWRGQDEAPTLERLLGALPADQAVVAYIDVPALRDAPTLGPWIDAKLAEQDDRLPLAAGIRGAAIGAGGDGAGGDSLYFATALDMSEAAAVSYLAQRRAGCSQPLEKEPCTTPAPSGGYLSMRLFEDSLFGVAHSGDPEAVELLGGPPKARVFQIQSAREALDSGALVWAALDPRRLDELMRNPPEGWTNLSLIATALGPAEHASLLARETTEGIVIELLADCADEAAAQELRSVLAGLNKMASALAAAGGGREWKRAADSFQATVEGVTVKSVWTLPTAVLTKH